jgi:hypothetical protein
MSSNHEISSLADRSLMETKENLNSGQENACFETYFLRMAKIYKLKKSPVAVERDTFEVPQCMMRYMPRDL